MQLSATPTVAPAPVRPPFIDRPGGSDQPAPHAVAQAMIQFPMNFGATALQDVRLGAILGSHASLEDARFGARMLAEGRTSLGVVRQADGAFAVAELLLYDNDQLGVDPNVHSDMPLAFGPDPARTRTVQSIHLLREPGDRPVLEGLWIRGGNTWITFDENGDGTVTFNHA